MKKNEERHTAEHQQQTDKSEPSFLPLHVLAVLEENKHCFILAHIYTPAGCLIWQSASHLLLTHIWTFSVSGCFCSKLFISHTCLTYITCGSDELLVNAHKHIHFDYIICPFMKQKGEKKEKEEHFLYPNEVEPENGVYT